MALLPPSEQPAVDPNCKMCVWVFSDHILGDDDRKLSAAGADTDIILKEDVLISFLLFFSVNHVHGLSFVWRVHVQTLPRLKCP